MDIKTIVEIAEDRIMSDLCIKWYSLYTKEALVVLTKEEEAEKDDLHNEIQEFYRKLNKR